MHFNRDIIFNKETILKFYNSLVDINYEQIDDSRLQELNLLLKIHEYYFWKNNEVTLMRIYFTAEKLLTNSKRFGLRTPTEVAYFFINIVDPKLKFLEIFECSNTKEEIRHNCLVKFQIYDAYLIKLEKNYNKYFGIIDSEELKNKDSIKRTRNTKNN